MVEINPSGINEIMKLLKKQREREIMFINIYRKAVSNVLIKQWKTIAKNMGISEKNIPKIKFQRKE